MKTQRDRAREAYARRLEQRGTAWANAAASVRSGYENVWISAALDEIQTHDLDGDDDP